MRERTPSGALRSTIEITPTTVQRGDIIQVGGRACRVSDLHQLPPGAERLLFESGELPTMRTRTRLVAVRMQGRR